MGQRARRRVGGRNGFGARDGERQERAQPGFRNGLFALPAGQQLTMLVLGRSFARINAGLLPAFVGVAARALGSSDAFTQLEQLAVLGANGVGDEQKVCGLTQRARREQQGDQRGQHAQPGQSRSAASLSPYALDHRHRADH